MYLAAGHAPWVGRTTASPGAHWIATGRSVASAHSKQVPFRLRAGWAPWPELAGWDWPWLDSLYVGYEVRGPQQASSRMLVTRSRMAWWSNAEGRPVGWGDAAGQAIPAGWIDPTDTTTTINTALERLVWRAVDSTGR